MLSESGHEDKCFVIKYLDGRFFILAEVVAYNEATTILGKLKLNQAFSAAEHWSKREPSGEILSAKREGPHPTFIPYPLANIFVKVLQIFAHRHHELVSVRAINNPVIVTNTQPDNVPDSN